MKDVQISKYRFFMISNPDFSLFFFSNFLHHSVENIVFLKSRNTVLKIFISRRPTNTTHPPTNTTTLVCWLCTEVPSFRFKAAIHAFLVHSCFGKVNRILSGLFLLEFLQLKDAHLAGHVVLQKEHSIHRIFHFLDKRPDIILTLS